MSNKNIFDDVFRTLLEKMPQLVIALINEIFKTNYPEDIRIEQRRNEHHTKDGTIITDSHLLIGNKMYHIECQSTDDSAMVIRMVEYDFSISLEYMQKEAGKYRMYFPYSCVLYLRGQNENDTLEIELIMPDGRVLDYQVPVVYVQKYTSDAIFQKRLFFLLPFYIMRYENQRKELEKDDAKLKALLEEYRTVEKQLEVEFLDKGKEKEYRDMVELIIRIADYILDDTAKTRKGFGEIMGGKVLELQSDKLIMEGMQQGIQKGIHQGIQKGVMESAEKLLKNGMSIEQTAAMLELPEETVRKLQENNK